ncbi:hypothetical protein ABMA27_007589 [Loxostege sticticalis]|uniref:Uncharacterized protein n=1 Tax=Loxostege sticticalis TaxID=481309 RepID=A0ABR3HFX8_LOXSC
MLNMKILILFAACLAAASAWGDWKEGLSVRFSASIIGAGRSFFISIPRTVATAKNSRWVETDRPSGPHPSLVMYCPSKNDVVVCALFDDNNNIAGLQIALPEDLWTGAVFDKATQGFTYWTAPANSHGARRNYWTIQQYFVSGESLSKTKEERMAAHVEGRVLQEKAVWVTAFNGELMKLSGIASEVTDTNSTLFTEQACIPLMGRHYFYNMTAETQCTSETILPWFPMVDRRTDQLIASGFMTFGKIPAENLVKNYFERPPRLQVELIVPDGPDCLYELTENYGGITMHIYYVDSPFLINCINN